MNNENLIADSMPWHHWANCPEWCLGHGAKAAESTEVDFHRDWLAFGRGVVVGVETPCGDDAGDGRGHVALQWMRTQDRIHFTSGELRQFARSLAQCADVAEARGL